MLEHYRDASVYLPQGFETDVVDTLAQWLIENRKAVEFVDGIAPATEPEAEPHYGAQAEPELKADDVKYEEQISSTVGSRARSGRIRK